MNLILVLSICLICIQQLINEMSADTDKIEPHEIQYVLLEA